MELLTIINDLLTLLLSVSYLWIRMKQNVCEITPTVAYLFERSVNAVMCVT